ncbi:hypothetical protein [Halosimplex salinum]|uniref:hypothetical protein n=1 Tax=Halosimplex salinum TaxID=1710538 RepID=UPI000F46A567|nr:hypothetical protein [Halosimplex salinum]
MSDPFAQALRDRQFGEQRGPLRYRNGEQTEEPGIDIYFEEVRYGDEGWRHNYQLLLRKR